MTHDYTLSPTELKQYKEGDERAIASIRFYARAQAENRKCKEYRLVTLAGDVLAEHKVESFTFTKKARK